MNKRINGKIGQYVILQSVIRSVLVCVFLLILGGGVNVFLKKGGINIVFLDQFLILSIGIGNAFDIQSILCGKAHIFTSSRKKIFRNSMQSAVTSSLVFALWRTFCQTAFYGQYVREFMEAESEALDFARVSVPELFGCNFILVLAVCIILLWRFGMGKDYGFLSIGIDMKTCSAQLQYLAAVRRKRRHFPQKIGQMLYSVVEFALIVAVMVCSTYLYYFQLRADMAMRMMVYAGILVIGGIFFLLAKHRFRPEFM